MSLSGVNRTRCAQAVLLSLTQLRHRLDRNPAAQQCRGVLLLSFESTGGTGSESPRVHHAGQRRGSEGAWPRSPTNLAYPRRRGDRISAGFAAIAHSRFLRPTTVPQEGPLVVRNPEVRRMLLRGRLDLTRTSRAQAAAPRFRTISYIPKTRRPPPQGWRWRQTRSHYADRLLDQRRVSTSTLPA
jgi:hypothetical protein